MERYAHEMLARLLRRGHEVRAVAFGRDLVGPASVDGVPVERVRPWIRVGNTPVHPGFGRLVATNLLEHASDLLVVHTPVPFPAEAAARAARGLGIPYVVVYHAGRLRGSSPLLDAVAAVDRATGERRMLEKAAGLVAVSPYVKENALAPYAGVQVVSPGVDVRRFSPSGPPEPASLFFTARLDASYRWKGVDVLLEAYRRLVRDVPEARLTIAGDGERRRALEVAAADLPGVRFVGRLSEDGLIDAYRRHLVTVLPSTSDAESFGMVLAEANACGRAVVASRVGGVPGFVREGENGRLVPPNDPSALADALAGLLREPQVARALGHRGRERVVAEHTWDLLAARLERALQGALEGAAPGGLPLDEPSRVPSSL